MQNNNNMKCKIVRYNENKRKMYVRTGRMRTDGSTIAPCWPPDSTEKCPLYVQLHIYPELENIDGDDGCFATEGDSGSLVFLASDDGKHMWAMGMIVGGIPADGSAIATPIWAVLDAFDLPRTFMSFKYDNLGNQFKELSAQVERVDKKVDKMDEKISANTAKVDEYTAKADQMFETLNQKLTIIMSNHKYVGPGNNPNTPKHTGSNSRNDHKDESWYTGTKL